MCSPEFDAKPMNSPEWKTSKAASLPVTAKLELFRIAGLTELEALRYSLPAVAREARRQVELRRAAESDESGADDDSGESSDWITITQAATLTGENKGTVSRWLNDGQVLDNKKTGRPRRVNVVSLFAYCKSLGLSIDFN